MSLRILIGDRDKDTRSIIKQIINSSLKCKFTEKEEVREFITAAINQDFDLAILDLDIQPQNNEKIISVIRSVHSNDKLPIVILASALDKEKIIGLLRLGIADIILKPIYQNSASDKLKNLLRTISARKTDSGLEDPVEEADEGSDTSGKGKFLLVDHDKGFRAQFMHLFGDKYEVISADNGQEGLQLFEKLRPEYVFVGEHLKLINERAMVQKIRSMPGGSEVKVYFFSTVLKSTAMKSNLFNGVVEKTAAIDTFHKEFRKVVFGEETSLFQKAGKVLRTELAPHLGSIAQAEFLHLVGMESGIIPQTSNVKIANEILAYIELIDQKQEVSVTIGLFGSSNDMLLIAEKITGAPTPFNSKAIEAIGSLIESVGQKVNYILSKSGITFNPQAYKVNNRLENKLNYDWDIEAVLKGPSNEFYKVGAYCSKFV
ncbi:MAG TPA: response regulator [Ignavibacteriales bacterium]|nr:response regulator [Ignavibacteriales bacterium]